MNKMLEKLKEINVKIIEQCSDDEEKSKQLLIQKILDEDNCFMKMNVDVAYALLRELNIDESMLKETYLELINPVSHSK